MMGGVNGYLVDVGSTQQMVKAISRVLDLDNHEWRAMSSHSKRIADNFTWDASAEKLERALIALRDGKHDVQGSNDLEED